MSSIAITSLITGGGLILSILSAVGIGSYRFGSLKEKVATLEGRQDKWATKDDLVPIKETLAEIKGMFRLELKERS